MQPNFDTVLQATRLLFPLLESQDEELYAKLQDAGVCPYKATMLRCVANTDVRMILLDKVEPFFAMPWMITWFAHQLSRFQDVARLYDVFLVSHPLFCLYVSAAVSEVFDINGWQSTVIHTMNAFCQP